MALLKDIKSRIQSVQSTQKITSAMMMVSSSKLRKAHNIFFNLSPYESKLSELLHIFLNDEKLPPIPFTQNLVVERVAIIAFSSNSGLCGRFNHNIIDNLKEIVKKWSYLGKDNILVYPVGDKVASAAAKMDVTIAGSFSHISENPSYKEADIIANKLMNDFVNGKLDRVELLYHHFKSRGTQVITHEPLLPIELHAESQSNEENNQYIIEPDRATLLTELIPKVIKLKLFTTHVDSVTSEHAARMIAMQIATDNADNLLEELKLEYNKLRQQSITNELLDIMGGATGR